MAAHKLKKSILSLFSPSDGGTIKDSVEDKSNFLNSFNFEVYSIAKLLTIAMLLFTLVFVSSFSIDSVNAADTTIQNTTDTIINETINDPTNFTEIYLNEGNYSVSETITIDRAITLIGNSSDKSKVVINGKGVTSIFNITPTGNLTLINITFANCFANSANGNNGGAIFNDGGNLSIINCAFENNYADGDGGAIYSANGIVNIKDSKFVGNNASNGGAIANFEGGSFTIINSTFTNNSAFNMGGAIANIKSEDVFTVINSTFENNIAGRFDEEGLPIFYTNESNVYTFYGFGGAIANYDSDYGFEIINSNFTGNLAAINGGAIYNDKIAYMNINESRFFNNSIYITVEDIPFGADDRAWDGLGIGGAICNLETEMSIYDCNFTDNSAYFCGGAIFNTLASLIINKSNFNYNSVKYENETEDPDEELYWYYRNGGAINNVNASIAIYNSNFNYNSAYYGGAIDNWAGDMNITNSNFTNNSAAFGGAVINWNEETDENTANMIIKGSEFIGNTAKFDGGAIENYRGNNLTIDNCLFENNTANGIGGAIDFVESVGTFLIINSIFNNNRANNNSAYDEVNEGYSGYGGAIANYDSSGIVIINSTFTNNSAYYGGGAIYNYGGSTVIINGSNFTNNFAEYDSGNIEDEELWAKGNGGAIFNEGIESGDLTELIIINCNFINNSASCGGAIDNKAANLIVINSNFTDNVAFYCGGAIENWIGGSINITGCNFTNNSAGDWGGAIENYKGGDFYIYHSIFINNRAHGQGGAIDNYNSPGELYIENCTFENNYVADQNY
ncbi:MAG: hypothetical protein FWE58_03400, partial [Methanobrevibacter sp.]|nr:hypothetical protein [Methanobrevibacter sp.]